MVDEKRKEHPRIRFSMSFFHHDKDENGELKKEYVWTDTEYDWHQSKKWVDTSPPREAMEHIDLFKLCRFVISEKVEYSSVALKNKQFAFDEFIDKNKGKDDEFTQ